MKKFLRTSCFPEVKSFAPVQICTLVLCLLSFSTQAQSQLLKDINNSEDISHNEFRSLTDGYNKVFLIVNNELWKTTGNDGGTVMLKRFKSIRNLMAIGSTAFFTADDGTGSELWKSSGTSGSTVKVMDFAAGTSGGNPEWLTNVNGTLYFVVYTPTYGRELWKSDGTESGTTLVKDIVRVKGSSNPASLINVNGTLYFAANDGQNGYEVWKSDGTANGTRMVVDARAGANLSSTPDFLTNVNGTLYFVANDGTSGRELWKTDGTVGGSTRLKDIRLGTGSPNIDNMTGVNNTLFFTANDGIHGFELWKSDGSETGTQLVKDMTPGPQGSHGEQIFTHQMGNFKSVFGLLYYTAYENDTYYIWKSDGTEAGTVPIQTAFHGINTPSPRFIAKGNYIYYFNSIPDEYSDNSFHLYRMKPDGSSQVIIAELFQEDFYSSYNPELIAFKNTLYFNARSGSVAGFQLYRSDGNPGSMILIKDPYQSTLGSDPSSMVKTANNKVFFMAYEEMYYYSPGLWTTDGTSEGTIKLKDISGINDIVATSTHVYFSVNYGLEIWKSDGTVDGTVLVKADPSISQAYNLINVNDIVYFRTYNGGLWRTDGSEAGTVSIPITDGVEQMVAVGDKLYFTLNRGYSTELWRTNGTDMGISEVYTFQAQSQAYNWPVAINGNILYFLANEGLTGNEVWRTDGTSAGTYQIADLHSADDNEFDISSLEVWDNHLYIGALDDTQKWALYKSNGTRGNAVKVVDLLHPVVEMIAVDNRLHFFSSATEDEWRVNNWVTDGTAEGTEVISEAFYFSMYSDHAVVNNILYYPANGNLSRSDGTSCGTFEVNLGVYGSDPIENIGNVLVFGGWTALSGYEPYSFNLARAPQSPCGMPIMTTARNSMENLMAAQEEGIGTPYPNPFSQDFSFRVNGSDNEFVDVDVFTTTGHPVEKIIGLKANTDYHLGHSWAAGLYILNIKTSGKMTAQKVLKK